MRWLAILIVASTAFAAPTFHGVREREPEDVSKAIKERDAAELATMVFATTAADRERVLDALIDLGKLDKKNRARVPTREVVGKELGKLVANTPRAQKLFAPASCVIKSITATEVALRCEPRGCEHSCMVVRGEATVKLKAGKWSIEGLLVKNVGDTGECGDCME